MAVMTNKSESEEVRLTSRRAFLHLAAAAGVAPPLALADETPNQKAPAGNRPIGTVCVAGASGNVGKGIVRELLAEGCRVIAISRSPESLERLRQEFSKSQRIETLTGDFSTDELAKDVSARLVARFGMLDGAVASLSSHRADVRLRILDTPSTQLREAFDTNFFTHVAAAKALIPALASRGVYVGINGGLADFVLPGMGHISMTQSALNSFYKTIAQEALDAHATNAAQVRALCLYGLVTSERDRARINDGQLTDEEIGRRVVAILRRPDAYPQPIQAIKSRRYA
jgi:NAD(P)-dependent dehydrogenase (short-subunit alcohol dehydrogenase family)